MFRKIKDLGDWLVSPFGTDNDFFPATAGVASCFIFIASCICGIVVLVSDSGIGAVDNPVFYTFLPWMVGVWFFLLLYPLNLLVEYATYGKVIPFPDEESGENVAVFALGLWAIYIVAVILFWLFALAPLFTIWTVVILGTGTGLVKLSRKTFMLADKFNTHKNDPDAHKKPE